MTGVDTGVDRDGISAERGQLSTILMGVEIDVELAGTLQKYADLVRNSPDALVEVAGNPGYEGTARQVAARWLAEMYFDRNEDSQRSVLLERTLGRNLDEFRETLSASPTLCTELGFAVVNQMKGLKSTVADQPMTLSQHYNYLELIRELMVVADEQTADELFWAYPIGRNQVYDDHASARIDADQRAKKIIEDPKMPIRHRMDCAGVLCKRAKNSIDCNPGDLDRTENELYSIGRIVEDLAQIDKKSDSDKTVVTSMVAFLELNSTERETYVRPANALNISTMITDPELKFDFLVRHVFLPTDPSVSEYCKVENAAELDAVLEVRDEEGFVRSYVGTLDSSQYHTIIAKADELIESYNKRELERSRRQSVKEELLQGLRIT